MRSLRRLLNSAAESAAMLHPSADVRVKQADNQLKTNELRLVARVRLQGRVEEIQSSRQITDLTICLQSEREHI